MLPGWWSNSNLSDSGHQRRLSKRVDLRTQDLKHLGRHGTISLELVAEGSGDQRADVVGLRSLEQLDCRPLLHHLAIAHHDQRAGKRCDYTRRSCEMNKYVSSQRRRSFLSVDRPSAPATACRRVGRQALPSDFAATTATL